ncbi:MAG TPA: cytochrome c3 family protein, partial [Gallionella sp.]
KTAKCVSCHKGDLYKDKLPSSCFLCHEKDDKHKGQEGKKCETCHDEQSWTRTTFNHGKMSTFPLLGRHMLVDCKKCHAAVTFKDAKSDCWSCHEKDDVHKRKLGSECQTCHNTRNWKAWDFNHNKTSFKLDGAHKKVAGKCDACHQKPMAKKVLLSGTCGSCHDRDDVHNGNFSDRCERCHEGDTWKQVKMGAIAPRKK